MANPDVYRPAALVPAPQETATFLRNLADPDNNQRPEAEEGDDALSTLADDDSETPYLKPNRTGAASESDAPAKKQPGQRFADRVNDVVKKVTDRASAVKNHDNNEQSTDD